MLCNFTMRLFAVTEVRKGKHIVGQCSAGDGKALDGNVKDFREQLAAPPATSAGRLLAFVEDEKASSKVVNVMLAHMPKAWDSTCLVEHALLETAADTMENGKSALQNLCGLWLYGTKNNHVFCGCDGQSAPTIRVQAKPSRYKEGPLSYNLVNIVISQVMALITKLWKL